VSSILATYVAYPMGFGGLILIFGTVFMAWWKGPHTHDVDRILIGAVFIIVSDIIWVISDLLAHDWLGAGADVGWTAILIWVYFGKPPKWRKKAMKLIGAKAKALRDKIVRKLKNARPRVRLRVPVPVPG
jgi:hypothetical protein